MALFDTIKSWFSKPSKSDLPMDSHVYEEMGSFQVDNQQTKDNSPSQTEGSSSTNEFIDKAKDFVSDSLDEAKEQGKQLWSELKEKVDQLDDSTREFRENLAEKAKDGLKKIDHFIDETVDKAKSFEEAENQKDQNMDGVADKPIDFGKNLEDSHPDFFSKAEKWLETQKDHTIVEHKNLPKNEEGQKKITPVELPDETKTN